jgi:glucoamylase
VKFISVIILLSAFACQTFAASGSAPGGPGLPGQWSRPDKEGFLASARQTVWATIAGGILTEVYYPTIDRAQTKDTELLIVSGGNFLEERRDFKDQVHRYPHSLAYHVSSVNPQTGIHIEKDIMLDPDRAGVIINYAVMLPDNTPTKIYVLHNPAADNTAGGDAAYVGVDSNSPGEIMAYQSDRRGDEPAIYRERTFQLLAVNRTVTEGSAGFEGVNDPWTQIHAAHVLQNQYQNAQNGNVAAALGFVADSQKVQFRVTLDFTLEGGTQTHQALRQMAKASLTAPSQQVLATQQNEWGSYLGSLNSIGQKLEADVLVLRGLVDKSYRGAIIAAPAMPSLPDSIEATEWDYEAARVRRRSSSGDEPNAGYHRVWPRDAVQMSLGLLAAGDLHTPLDTLRFLQRLQLPSGTFPQNTWVDGQVSWNGFQLDQTGYPIILTSRLVELNLADYNEFRDMVVRAADAIIRSANDHGGMPYTSQERWEENDGLSPNSIAIACQGLAEAAWLERTLDPGRSQFYASIAQKWLTSIWGWTFVTNGALGQNYFERMEVGNDPGHNAPITIHNSPAGGSIFPENAIIDGGFIQLFVSGLLDAMDPRFASSLAVYDKSARGPAPQGQVGFLRYNHDGYGLNHVGKTWPLLSGERALAAISRNENPNYFIHTMLASVQPSGMICEQVDVSACPLGWSHAEMLIVARSVAERKSWYIPRHQLKPLSR